MVGDCGGFDELNRYLPEYLLPFFTGGLDPPPSSVGGQATPQPQPHGWSSH